MKLSKFRSDLTMTQEAFARSLGMKSKSYICEIEKAEAANRPIPIPVALAVYRTYGVTLGPIEGLKKREIELVARTLAKAA